MKVLFINQVFGQGSTGHIVADLVDAVNNNGGDAYVAYGVGQSDYKNSLNFSTRREYVRHARYWAHLLGLHGRGSHISTYKLLKWIDKINPDIIHLHNIHGSYINFPMLFKYAKNHDIPVVWTLHDCWCLTGHCMHFFIAGCDKWKTGCKHCSYNGQYKERSIIKNSGSAFDFKMKTIHSIKDNLVLVPVSKWLEDILRESHLKDCNIERIYNGIDLDVFKPTPTDIRHKYNLVNKYIILGVATSWSDAKGLSDYIKISERLSEEFQIILIGLSQSQIESLPPNIIGINRTNSKAELVEYYNAADVVTSLSYGESMGLTPVEGMACGTPAIVYDNTAQPELIDNNTGTFVKTGDIDSVIQAINKFKSIGKGSFSKDCISRAHSLFAKETFENEYLLLFNKLMYKKLGGVILLGVSSVWNDGKGLQEFIRLSQFEEYIVVLVGVSEEVRKKLPEQIIAFGCMSCAEDLASIYRMADVFVNPTYADSFPTVNLEALACGKPVVTYNTGGSPEAINSKTGRIAERGNFKSLKSKIDEMTKELGNSLSVECRNSALRLFNKPDYIKKYLELYKSLIISKS